MSSERLNDSQSFDSEEASVQEAAEVEIVETNDELKNLSSKIYEEEWARMCGEELELEGVRARAVKGELRTCRLRSVSWLLMLGALTPGSPQLWSDQAAQARRHYAVLSEQLAASGSPSPCLEPSLDNPLSQHDQSTWHQYFCDRELRSVIRQDVVRTFPGVDFFRDPEIQEAMINVLFAYARENPTMCYRQGMHEVLAPLLFVLHCDHQALLHTLEQGSVSPEICDLVNPKYLEEDSYTLFRRIMNAIEGSYLISDLAPTSTGYFPPRPKTSDTVSENQVVSQLNWIKERLFAPNDPQLHQHLEKLDIPLPIFGIRWLRLMFGREFPLQDLLVLWDAIFADSSSFDLVNYIVVAMLIAIRDNLLSSDYTACLTLLMRYPGSMDISFIIEYALHLKEPSKYSTPMMKALPQVAMTVGRRRHAKSPERRRTNPQNNYAKKSGGRNHKLTTMKPPLPATPQVENSIIDGFTLDDPVVLTAELRNAYAVMSLCKLKLEHYYNILESAVPSNNIPAQEALTGVHELCSLLEPRLPNSNPLVVEPAYEAGENGKLIGPNTKKEQQPRKSNHNVMGRKPSIDMTVFKQTVTPLLEPS